MKQSKNYSMLIVSSIIVLISVLWLIGSVNLIKELQKNNLLTGFAISNDTKNQTQSNQEIYSIGAYTFFYLSIIFILVVVAVIALILIVPRIKKYT